MTIWCQLVVIRGALATADFQGSKYGTPLPQEIIEAGMHACMYACMCACLYLYLYLHLYLYVYLSFAVVYYLYLYISVCDWGVSWLSLGVHLPQQQQQQHVFSTPTCPITVL